MSGDSSQLLSWAQKAQNKKRKEKMHQPKPPQNNTQLALLSPNNKPNPK